MKHKTPGENSPAAALYLQQRETMLPPGLKSRWANTNSPFTYRPSVLPLLCRCSWSWGRTLNPSAERTQLKRKANDCDSGEEQTGFGRVSGVAASTRREIIIFSKTLISSTMSKPALNYFALGMGEKTHPDVYTGSIILTAGQQPAHPPPHRVSAGTHAAR